MPPSVETASGSSGNEPNLSDRIIDITTVALISLAAVCSAWCGYQAARWSALQALDYNLATAAHVAATTASGRSNAVRVLDVALFVNYEGALYAHNDQFAAFLRRRFTPQLGKAVSAWLATKPLSNPKAPLSPFAMRAYTLPSDRIYAQAVRRAGTLTRIAQSANDLSDRYVFLTVIFASVSFLGGLAPKLRPPNHIVLTCVDIVLLCASLAVLAGFPVR